MVFAQNFLKNNPDIAFVQNFRARGKERNGGKLGKEEIPSLSYLKTELDPFILLFMF